MLHRIYWQSLKDISVLIQEKDEWIYLPVVDAALTFPVMAEFIHIRNRV